MSEKNQISIQSVPVRPPTATTSDDLVELQKRRELLQIAQLERQAAREAEEQEVKENRKRSELAMRKSIVQQMLVGKAARENAQANCPHLKENGKTAVGGQRDSRREHHWICQSCMKEWTGINPLTGGLPMHLRPDPSTVGGPDF